MRLLPLFATSCPVAIRVSASAQTSVANSLTRSTFITIITYPLCGPACTQVRNAASDELDKNPVRTGATTLSGLIAWPTAELQSLSKIGDIPRGAPTFIYANQVLMSRLDERSK
jgi:hypothetical protein